MTPETGIYEYAKHGLSLSADKTALWYYGKSITYRELFKKIDNAADHLYSLGVREGTVVTIHLPNCPQAVIAVYAVAKLGGICNMVHAQTPSAALRENMAFTESGILVTCLPDCTGAAKTVFYVDISCHMGFLYRTGFRIKSKTRRPADARPFEALEQKCSRRGIFPVQTELAEKCVVYFHSSGTTGEPKTVMHCHRAINNWVANAKDFFGRDSMQWDVLLAALPMFHGSGFAMDMHQLLSGGGTLVQMAKWDVKQAADFIKKYKITCLTGVPKIYYSLLQNPHFSGESIRHCYVSGDIVGTNLKRAFNKRIGLKSCLYEGYGMTETVTACFSCGEMYDNTAASGYPLVYCEIAVINEDGEMKSTGEGEFLVSTNTLMMGYLKDEEATSSAFITVNGKRWLRTGDYGRVDEDGYIYFVERIKDVIVHNGYNIFPSELEAITRKHPNVEDVCIVGVKEPNSGTQIIRACIVLAPGADPVSAEEELKKYWEKQLPQYAIPRQIRFIEALPRNRMVKIDRKALGEIL